MIISRLPDCRNHSKETSPQLNNTVLYAYTKEKYSYPSHSTPYLFVTNFLNKGHYLLNKQRIQTSEKCFYFLNPHDELAIAFNDSAPLKTLLVFFNDEFVKQGIYVLTSPAKKMLEKPFDNSSSEFLNFPSVPFQSTQVIANLTLLLTQNYLDQHELDNRLFDLIEEFIKLNKSLSNELKNIDAIKRSTKEELYKRLFTAREFMEDNALQTSLTIDEIAKEACLNKFHFLANFKTLYGVTPHQYIVNLKLKKAYQLLQKKQHSVAEVCYIIGFESITSFSNLFKRNFNIPPSAVLRNSKVPNFQ